MYKFSVPDLATPIERKQAGIALVMLAVILGATAYFFPKREEPAPVIVQERPAPDAYKDVSVLGKSAIVYDLTTGHTLFERNADAQLPLASLTKLLSAYAASEALAPSTLVTIDAEDLAAEGDSGLQIGEVFALKDIAKLALVASSNDAAEAITNAARENRSLTTEDLLKNAAASVHLSQTYAVNGTGLDENESVSGGYGSAHDVARLAGAILAKAPELAKATTEHTVTVQSLNGITHTLPNTDPSVDRFPNLLLSKTGFTDLAGGNLVVVFDAGLNHPVAVVVLGSTRESRFTDVETLIHATLAHFAKISPS